VFTLGHSFVILFSERFLIRQEKSQDKPKTKKKDHFSKMEYQLVHEGLYIERKKIKAIQD